MAWQIGIIPQGYGLIKYGMATNTISSDPILGKVRHSRKETRLEAKRMLRSFMTTVQEIPIDGTREDVESIRAHQMVQLYGCGYEHLGVMVMRWQPGEED